MNKSELFHLREGTFQLILLYQSALLDGYHADVAEGNAKIERLQDKLQELESQKVENEQVISEAGQKDHIAQEQHASGGLPLER